MIEKHKNIMMKSLRLFFFTNPPSNFLRPPQRCLVALTLKNTGLNYCRVSLVPVKVRVQDPTIRKRDSTNIMALSPSHFSVQVTTERYDIKRPKPK